MSWQQKLTKRRLLGRTFVKKNRNWMDFGIPGEAIGRALGRILGKKIEVKKKGKKKWTRWLPRREARAPARRDFGRTNKQDPTRPWPTLSGWAGGLFTLRASRRGPKRLRGWEALRMGGEDVYKSYYCWLEAAKQRSNKAAKQQSKTQPKKQPKNNQKNNQIRSRMGSGVA